MTIRIVDSNYLRKPELRAYLAASRSNRIAITQEVLVEMHKREPALTVKSNLEIARAFPTQLVVLQDVTRIYGRPIRSAADARTLVDSLQTRNFSVWYDDIVHAGDDQAISNMLEYSQKNAQMQISEIASSVAHIQPIFRKIKNKFNADELKQLRNRKPYSDGTQRKLLEVVFGISRALFLKTNLEQSRYPKLNEHAFRYFIFRYAMCMMLLYTRWVHIGNLSDDTDKLVNHVMDMHLAALGTFFGGVLSDDEMLIDVHREARWLLRSANVAFVG